MGYLAIPNGSLGPPCGLYTVHDIVGTEKYPKNQVVCEISFKLQLIAIQLHYLCKIPGVTVLYHRRRTVHSIFQMSISQNTKCGEILGFPRDGHS